MEKDYQAISMLILGSSTNADTLKDLCEQFLEKYCNQEGLVLYSKLIRLIAEKENIEIE